MGAMREYLMSGLWCYELPADSFTRKDRDMLFKYNLMYRKWMEEELYIIGSFNNILSYLNEYMGVEVVNDNLIPIKKLWDGDVEFRTTLWRNRYEFRKD